MDLSTGKGLFRGIRNGVRDWAYGAAGTLNDTFRRLDAMALDQWAVVVPAPETPELEFQPGLDLVVIGGWTLVGGVYVRANDVPLTMPDDATRYIERVGVQVFVVEGAFTPVRIPIARVVTAGGAITLVEDARPHMVGPQGEDGIDGIDGINGTNGVSVVDATVEGDELKLLLSDASIINAGDVRGPQGPAGSLDSLDALLDVNGALLTKVGGDLAKLAPGDNGHVLTMVEGLPAYAAPAGGGGGGGGAGFPDDAASYGAATDDDEEWDGDASAWTVATALGGGNAFTVNAAFAPSRLRVHHVAQATDVLSLTRALTVSASGDISVTFDAAGVFRANFRQVFIGFREGSGSPEQGIITGIAHNGSPTVYLRKYTSISAPTVIDQTLTLGAQMDPRRIYFHLQRVSGTWSAWYSLDAVSWTRVGTRADAFTITQLWVFFSGGGGATLPYYAAVDWIRLNRFFL